MQKENRYKAKGEQRERIEGGGGIVRLVSGLLVLHLLLQILQPPLRLGEGTLALPELILQPSHCGIMLRRKVLDKLAELLQPA